MDDCGKTEFALSGNDSLPFENCIFHNGQPISDDDSLMYCQLPCGHGRDGCESDNYIIEHFQYNFVNYLTETHFIFFPDCGDHKFYDRQDSSLPLTTDNYTGKLY